MKRTNKRNGISLIVLVITIIVMIILAAAIILSLNSAGIIGKANKGKDDVNLKQLEEAAIMGLSEAQLKGYDTDEELEEQIQLYLLSNGYTSEGLSKYYIGLHETGVIVVEKVTTLAGTSWKFNEQISGYNFLDYFNYEEQTGWEQFPDGCKIESGDIAYEFWGLTLSEFEGITSLGTVQSIGEANTLNYIPVNNLSEVNGWSFVDSDTAYKFLNGEITTVTELLEKMTMTGAPTITFAEESNEALMNGELINWLYRNAKRIY